MNSVWRNYRKHPQYFYVLCRKFRGMKRPDNMVVLITGGTGALGSVVTKQFLREGSSVVTTYIESEEYDDLKDDVPERLQDRLTGFKVDVTSEEQVDGLVQKTLDEHGRIDVLLNLVGGWRGGREIQETGKENWEAMLDINLKSAFLVSKHVIPVMRDHNFGRIISIGAKTGHELPAEGGPYAIAKHGVESLTTVIAKENKEYNITANCLLPSIIDTPANRETMGTENADKWVKPEEIAGIILETVQDTEKNGERIPVYGGLD